MKFNVRPTDCKFIVNKDKRMIVCIYEGCAKDFIRFINTNSKLQINSNFLDFYSNWSLYDKMLMPNRFAGTAQCSAEDEWNENIGKLIAFSRMKDNLNKSFFKRAQTFVNTISDWLDETVDLINDVGNKLSENQAKRHSRIDMLIDENNKEDA